MKRAYKSAEPAKVPKVVLLIESSRASGRALLRGVAGYTQHHRPWSFYWEPRGLDIAHGGLKKLDADGIIFRDVGTLKAQVLRLGIPAVVIGHAGSEVRGLINVVTDSPKIGQMGAEHLLQCGFRHFAFFGYAGESRDPAGKPLEQTSWSKYRLETFTQKVVEAGFAPPSVYILPAAESDSPANRNELADWLSKLPLPLGVMACNDDCAVQVLEACKLAGLAVPDSVGIVGVDNDEVVCGLTNPPLTSVALNFERAGYEAAEALEGLMSRGRAVQNRILAAASHVVARRSTDFVAVDEPYLIKALHYIRDNARTSISVDDVTRATGLSRRALEKRFRRILGRSIFGEIRRIRTDQIARLLVETDMSVTAIAELLGFPDVHHVARYFRAAKGLSPGSYRRKYSR